MNTPKYAPLILATVLNGCAAPPAPHTAPTQFITITSSPDNREQPDDLSPINEPFVSNNAQKLLNEAPLQLTDTDEENLWQTARSYFGKYTKNGENGIQIYNICRNTAQVTKCRDIWHEEYLKAARRNPTVVEQCTQKAKTEGHGDNEWNDCVLEGIDTHQILRRISYACEQKVLQCVRARFSMTD